MAPRSSLQTLLESFTEHVYHNPPSKDKMVYPCITYKRDEADTIFANNKPYRHYKRYQVIVIDRSPDSSISDAVRELPMCKFDRYYAADNLNHDVFNLFF